MERFCEISFLGGPKKIYFFASEIWQWLIKIEKLHQNSEKIEIFYFANIFKTQLLN